MNLKKGYDKTLKYIPTLSEDWLEVYENCADRLSNNLRLNEISTLSFFQFYCKINRNQLEIVVKATYGLHSNKYFEILNLTFWGSSLVTRRFGLHSDSWGTDEIKGLLISIDFCNRNTELLLLLSIISSWWNHVVAELEPSFRETVKILQLSGNLRLESLLELIKPKIDTELCNICMKITVPFVAPSTRTDSDRLDRLENMVEKLTRGR